ncbi:MAG: LPD7 domain-containing protein, partial [Phycisphaerales bacterium]
RDIRDYRGRITDAGVAYYLAGASRADFVDRGREVAIGASDEAAILAGLQLAQAKFGVIQLDGPARAVRRAALIAAQHGIRLKNPELQDLWEAERERARVGALIEYPSPVRAAPPTKREDIQKMADVQPGDSAAEAAYRLHLTAVFWERRQQGLATNWSVIDREASLRMRMTGHTQDEICSALESLAPRLHPEHRDDWREYSERAASAAFTPGADRELEAMQHMRSQLYGLESREDPESPRAKMAAWQREREEAARRRAAEQQHQGVADSRPATPRGPGL